MLPVLFRFGFIKHLLYTNATVYITHILASSSLISGSKSGIKSIDKLRCS